METPGYNENMLSLSVSFTNSWVAPMAPAVRSRNAVVTMVEPSNLDLATLDKYMSLPVTGKIQVRSTTITTPGGYRG